MPFLLNSNYHQSLSLSLHNGCQETLRAPLQKLRLTLDLQPPNWDNVCRLTLEGRKLGVGVRVRKWVWDGRLWSPLPFNCWGIWVIKSNSKNLVSIIQTVQQRQYSDSEKERLKREDEERKLHSSPFYLTIHNFHYCIISVFCLLHNIQNHFSSAQITTAVGLRLFHMERKHTQR